MRHVSAAHWLKDMRLIWCRRESRVMGVCVCRERNKRGALTTTKKNGTKQEKQKTKANAITIHGNPGINERRERKKNEKKKQIECFYLYSFIRLGNSMWILCMPKWDPYAVATTTVRRYRDFRWWARLCIRTLVLQYRFGIRKMNFYILCVINYFLVADVYLIYVAFFSSFGCCSSDHRH